MTDEVVWQFDLPWALADLHLSRLGDDDFLLARRRSLIYRVASI
jgi:hypothetical protein